MNSGQRPRIWSRALPATVAALILVVIGYLIADAVVDDFSVNAPGGDGPERVPFGAALFGVVVGGVAGAVLALLAGRLSSRPRSTFLAVCLVGLVLYGIYAFAQAENVATGIWLNILHIVAAVPIVGGLMTQLPDRRNRSGASV